PSPPPRRANPRRGPAPCQRPDRRQRLRRAAMRAGDGQRVWQDARAALSPIRQTRAIIALTEAAWRGEATLPVALYGNGRSARPWGRPRAAASDRSGRLRRARSPEMRGGRTWRTRVVIYRSRTG